MTKIDFRNKDRNIDIIIENATNKRDIAIAKATEKATEKAISKICKALIFQATRDHEIYNTLYDMFKDRHKVASESHGPSLYDYKPYSRTKFIEFNDNYIGAAWFLAACNIFVQYREEISLCIGKGKISVQFDENTFFEHFPKIEESLNKIKEIDKHKNE